MSMTSTQVKLLSLAARINGIEFEAQQLELEKLKLSAESGRIYEKYLNSLDLTKYQYKKILSNGNIIFRDATLNAMENGIVNGYCGEFSNNTFFLIDKETNKLLLTPVIAKEFCLDKSEDSNIENYDYINSQLNLDTLNKIIMKENKNLDSEEVVDFIPVRNSVIEPTITETEYLYTPVFNEKNGINYESLDMYSKFNNTHSEIDESVYKISESSELDDLIAAKVCQIDSAKGLKRLEKLSHECASSSININVILTDNIDMFDYVNWAGIRNFSGMFDGNGYVISNLSGIQGLFANTTDATVKNIGLDNINITGNLSYIGGLIGYAKTTNITNCYTSGIITNGTKSEIRDTTASDNKLFSCGTGGLIGFSYANKKKNISYNNVYSSVDVKGSDGVGGLIGTSMIDRKNSILVISNAYSTGNISGNKGVGGLIGIMHNYEDNLNYIAVINNSYSGGNVTGLSNVGGLIGAYLCNSRSRTQYPKIKNCNSTGFTKGISDCGTFIGHLYLELDNDEMASLSNYKKIFDTCAYAVISDDFSPIGFISDSKGQDRILLNIGDETRALSINSYISFNDSHSVLNSYYFSGSIPSISKNGSGAYFSNIKALLQKSGNYDKKNDKVISDKISKFLLNFCNNNLDNTKLWYLNNAICAYLTGIENNDLVEKLVDDIYNSTVDKSFVYQTGDDLQGLVCRGCGNSWDRTPIRVLNKGKVTIPSIETLTNEIFFSMKKSGYQILKDDIIKYLSKYDINNVSDRISLANINEKIYNKSSLNRFYDSVKNADCKYYDDTKWGDISKWEISVMNSDIPVKTIKNPSISTKYIDDEFLKNNPDLTRSIVKLLLFKRGFKIVTPEQASSSCWFSNIINSGSALLVTFNSENILKHTNLLLSDLDMISKEQCDQLLGINLVSDDEKSAYLFEMSDEISIKKAEHLYQTNIDIIDKKDKNYNMQIANLEKEKNELKNEIESLKVSICSKVERSHSLTN